MLKPLASLVAACVVAVTWSLHPFGIGARSAVLAATPPLVGFSFSPATAQYYGLEPTAAFHTLLDKFDPDVVRLPVYWDRVEPARGHFDYREVDNYLRMVARHNRVSPGRAARVLLVVGVRNMAFPELWVPAWVDPVEARDIARVVEDPEYVRYLTTTFARYAHHPLLGGWQVENEALDDVVTTAADQTDIPQDALKAELAALHRVDPVHSGVVTTYNSATLDLDLLALSPEFDANGLRAEPAGHPFESLQVADVLGIDAYVVTGSTSLADADARKRVDWKEDALKYWSGQARAQHKELWLTEMQAAPWLGHSDFTTDDFIYSAVSYRRVGASAVIMWGAESWLTSESWMRAALQARDIFRS